MKTAILAGGFGTRLTEETILKPKPMVEIGGKPILWHIMKLFASYDLSEFVVALGYKGEVIKDYFINYHIRENDLTIRLSEGKTLLHKNSLDDWIIHLIDTGLHTQTGGRIKRIAEFIKNETFILTYGDGVANINIHSLLNFHKQHGRIATVTAVRPPARFGEIKFDGDNVVAFHEKSQVGEGWINGGFFVLEPGVINYISGDESSFEKEPMEALARDNQLVAYRHEGFWQCMDTMRDVRALETMWHDRNAPWKVWKDL